MKTNGNGMNSSKNSTVISKKIVWVENIPDYYLHKMAKIEILKALAQNGHNVTLVMPYSSLRNKKIESIQIIAIPLKSIRLLTQLMFNIFLLLFLPIYILIRKPDFLITAPNGTIFGFFSTFFLKKLGFKLCLDIRSTPVEIAGVQGLINLLCFNISVSIAKKMFDGITIITPLMKEEVCESFSINPYKMGIFGSAVSTKLFEYKRYAEERKRMRNKFGLSDKFVVFYHGVFTPKRGLIECVKAMSILKQRAPKAVLFLLGTGNIVKELKNLIQEEMVQNNVILHDVVDYEDVPKYISICDLGIVPLPNISYWRYQCPLKLLEYLAMEKTVILTDLPAHRRIIDKKECGIFISSTNPKEISKAIMYAFENRDKLDKCGATGREIVLTNYTWKEAAKNLENFLLSL